MEPETKSSSSPSFTSQQDRRSGRDRRKLGVSGMITILLFGWTSFATASIRPNVVAEIPGLDVGPLISVTIAKGDTARLPCRHPTHSDDTVSLVLWYLNHTSRPFLSYDARDKNDQSEIKKSRGKRSCETTFGRKLQDRRRRNSDETGGGGGGGGGGGCQIVAPDLAFEGGDRNSRELSGWLSGADGGLYSYSVRGRDRTGGKKRRSSRMSLEGGGGTSLVIREVTRKDEAEYRCRVHFRLSPTWTQRLLLTVAETIYDVELTDTTGMPLEGPSVGPLAEGDSLSLACQANHGDSKVLSLDWLLEGVEIDTTWASAEKGVVINQLTISGLEQRHRNSRLTCRLTTSDPAHAHISANITDASIIITMFYVPESKLLVEGGHRSADGGGGREVLEGKSITFFCSVRADPPAYNITWLHNGRVVSVTGRRWRRNNTSLVISPVNRNDSGLYTCLASNSEGDGHSNAVHLKVAHAPYCSGNPQSQLVVAANKTIKLSCQMEAVPKDISFTWMVAPPPPMPIPKAVDPKGMVIPERGEIPQQIPHLSNVLNLPPGQALPSDPDYRMTHNPMSKEVPPLPPSWPKEDDLLAKDSLLPHRVDPSSPVKSYATITPTAPIQVICYARNRVGRTRVPCTYALNVVEPPGPLQSCNITGISETKLEVKCDTHAHLRSTNALDDAGHIHHSPSLGYVRSPEASSRANLEVWTGNTLLANVSNPRPEFKVRGLPPGASLKLILYSATAHTRSSPVYMYARTPPRTTVHLTVPPSLTEAPKPEEKAKRPSADSGGGMGGLGVAIAVLVGGVGLSIFILVAVIMLMRRRQRRRLAEEEITSEHLPTGDSKEILALNIPVAPAESEVPHIALTSHTPPPPKMLSRSSERLCRGSKESLKSCGQISLRGERASCSRDRLDIAGKASPRAK
ncbi:LOW QUALITY PROTEIN: uncharacterized protein LOC135215257 [Macrobrachium nipponense]|uniref:LOW QUALITY PROTEIN: uncharacterized protein LOC135215257 n=1 Tax=Macrobrachium nipponense TaxID=159736 RepID=UPI0030C86836